MAWYDDIEDHGLVQRGKYAYSKQCKFNIIIESGWKSRSSTMGLSPWSLVLLGFVYQKAIRLLLVQQ